MPTGITLPNCLLDTYRQLFPALDFSRLRFFAGVPAYLPGDRGAITLAYYGSINIFIKVYDPCTEDTFTTLAHELVHAVQIQDSFLSGYGFGFVNGFDIAYVTCLISTFSGARGNEYENEAYDFEDKLNGCIERPPLILPCQCVAIDDWLHPDPNFVSTLFDRCPLLPFQRTSTSILNCIPGGIWGVIFLFGLVWFLFALVVAIVITFLSSILDLLSRIIGAIISFFLGGGGARALNLVFSQDRGLTFTNHVMLGQTSSEQPAVLLDGGRLYLAWVSSDDDHVRVVALPGAANPIALDEANNDAGVALAAGGGHVFLAWLGTDQRLRLRVSSAGNLNFGPVTVLDEYSPDSATPGLAYGNERLFLAWIGTDNRLNIMSSPDGGASWESKVTLGETSGDDGTAAVAVGGDELFLSWAGTDDDNLLNIASYRIAPDVL